MVFYPKYKNSGDTKHLRMPIAYADLLEKLMQTLDQNYNVEKGRHLLRKFIDNLS